MGKSTNTKDAYPTFRIFFRIGEDDYSVKPLPTHPEVAHRAYRMLKLTGAARIAYDCHQQRDGTASCECLGFLKHGHRKPCRHLRTLVAAGMFAPIVPTPKKVEEAPTSTVDEPTPLFVDQTPAEDKVPMALPI